MRMESKWKTILIAAINMNIRRLLVRVCQDRRLRRLPQQPRRYSRQRDVRCVPDRCLNRRSRSRTPPKQVQIHIPFRSSRLSTASAAVFIVSCTYLHRAEYSDILSRRWKPHAVTGELLSGGKCVPRDTVPTWFSFVCQAGNTEEGGIALKAVLLLTGSVLQG